MIDEYRNPPQELKKTKIDVLTVAADDGVERKAVLIRHVIKNRDTNEDHDTGWVLIHPDSLQQMIEQLQFAQKSLHAQSKLIKPAQ